ncbi:endolytic transglycosylase MltG [Luteimonas mephitis]|uniref:endolytic transglycosylase MltG n=1 Tax=Luteimonas mephitis TaxID=83615 RepID=UPI000688E71A|nr:endolytic transglycosylase MltG [Luteimonas mephitis]
MSAPRKRGRGLRAFFVLSALLVGALAYWAYDRYTAFVDTPLSGLQAGDSVVVERGDSFAKVLQRLRDSGVTEGHDLEWQALAKQLQAAGKIQVGEYPLDPGTTPRALLLRMRDGKVLSYRFTIVEGWNVRQLRAALAKARPLRQETAELDDAALMKTLGHPGQHPEGRFLPETYAYTRNDSDLDLLKRAHAALDKALDAAWQSRAADLPLASKDEALVLASIVEKETGIASERAQIAGVFLRRIKLGMRLQTDPTVIYGMGSAYAGNLRKADLLADTPYNTYTRDGLPPTPIAMVGADALQAVTHPADGDALYFVAVGDGSGKHVFSKTLAEHQAAVREYIRRYRAQYGPK